MDHLKSTFINPARIEYLRESSIEVALFFARFDNRGISEADAGRLALQNVNNYIDDILSGKESSL